jgi:hypothetical protein
MKTWITKALAYLDKSLGKIPSELNEIECKIKLFYLAGIWKLARAYFLFSPKLFSNHS